MKNKKELDFNKIFKNMGLDDLSSEEKFILENTWNQFSSISTIQTVLPVYMTNNVNPKDLSISADKAFLPYFFLKYQLKINKEIENLKTQNSQLIEQNNQIIELLQKIANK